MIELEPSESGSVLDLEIALVLSVWKQEPVQFRWNFSSEKRITPSRRALVEVLGDVSAARVEWGERTLFFEPTERTKSGDYRFDLSQYATDERVVSVSPVLRTLLNVLAANEEESVISLCGGTHVRSGVPYSYLNEVYAPLIRRFGFRFEPDLRKWGFAPGGDGSVRMIVSKMDPTNSKSDVSILYRGSLKDLKGVSAVGNLPPDILRRQTRRANDRLEQAGYGRVVCSEPVESRSPGTVVHLTAQYEHVRAGFYAYGQKEKRARNVAREAVDRFLDYEKSEEPVNSVLGERVIVPGLLGAKSTKIRITDVTGRLRRAILVAREFGYESTSLEEHSDGSGTLILDS